MFGTNLSPFQTNPTMHMTHQYKSKFSEVVQAFICKYNEKSRFCNTTICHVEQLNDDEFQFVRRLENIMSNKPLFEKITVNRSTGQMHGYTFEDPSDTVYSEHYIYKCENDHTSYNMYLFRDPGLKKLMRHKMHMWGVQNT
jgi:hypothetical protein